MSSDADRGESMVLSTVQALLLEQSEARANDVNNYDEYDNGTFARSNQTFCINCTNYTIEIQDTDRVKHVDNYWALFAIVIVIGTACGNILVCLAIAWERRLQNVTNYFLASLALTDLMVATFVMPLGILTLFRGENIKIMGEICLH